MGNLYPFQSLFNSTIILSPHNSLREEKQSMEKAKEFSVLEDNDSDEDSGGYKGVVEAANQEEIVNSSSKNVR